MRSAFVLVLAGGLLAACGGDDSERTGGPANSQSKPTGSTPKAKPPTQLSVPALYDTSQGWETGFAGNHFVLPRNKAIAIYKGGLVEGRFVVHDVTTGKVLWKSVQVTAEGEMDLSNFSVTVDGKEYLVIASSGVTEDDLVSKGKEVTRLDIFDVSKGSGNSVRPTQHVELDGVGDAEDGGAGILVTYRDSYRLPTGHVVVDPATGATETYESSFEAPASCGPCHDGELVGLTADGPLVSADSYSGEAAFWQVGGWASSELLPEGAGDVVYQIDEDNLVTFWPGETGDVWAVLDSGTGEIKAEVQCPASTSESLKEWKSVSASGRYLGFGNVVFDLEQGNGRCFVETEEAKAVEFYSVIDDGTAFGFVGGDEEEDGTLVQVDVAGGNVQESKAAIPPQTEIDGYGIFLGNDDDENARAVATGVVYPRKK
ncbi:MAG TPA: hypothetical protein VI076_13145 [Actinopolymorphaceae bacterium]